MDERVVAALVTPDPIEAASVMALVDRPEADAVALYVGQVRDHDPDAVSAVVGLDYSTDPSASDRIGEIVATAVMDAAADSQTRVAALHRIGSLAVGESAFIVAISSPHRHQAFAVCELVVERVKQQLPVWKQQFEADGTYHWSRI